jgi:hypothetical protein
MNMPGASGFEDFYNGGYGILKKLDLSDLRQPLDEVRSYLAAKYDERFRIHPRLFEQVVGSVFNNLGRAYARASGPSKCCVRNGNAGVGSSSV